MLQVPPRLVTVRPPSRLGMGVLLFPSPGAGLAGSESGKLHKGTGMAEPTRRWQRWKCLDGHCSLRTGDSRCPCSCRVLGVSWRRNHREAAASAGADGPCGSQEGFGMLEIKGWSSRSGLSQLCLCQAPARPSLGTERVMSQFLRSRKGFIFLGFQRRGAGTHSGSPAWCSGGAGSSLEPGECVKSSGNLHWQNPSGMEVSLCLQALS